MFKVGDKVETKFGTKGDVVKVSGQFVTIEYWVQNIGMVKPELFCERIKSKFLTAIS